MLANSLQRPAGFIASPPQQPSASSPRVAVSRTPVPLRHVTVKIFHGQWDNGRPMPDVAYEFVQVQPPLTLDRVTAAARDHFGDDGRLYDNIGVPIPQSVDAKRK